MQNILLVVQVLISITLIALILLQHGKGADAGAAFGSGSSATVFGASGSASFLSRTTGVLATLFFAVSMTLTVLAYRQSQEQGLVEKYSTKTEAPAVTREILKPATDIPVAPMAEKQSINDVSKSPAIKKTAHPVDSSAPASAQSRKDK